MRRWGSAGSLLGLSFAVLVTAGLTLPAPAAWAHDTRRHASHRGHWRQAAARHATAEGAEASDAGAKTLSEPYVEACVMEPATGTVIFAKDMHKPWPTASVTKMMLMLIVAEKVHNGALKLSEPITASRKASKMGGSQVYLKEGETFSLDDMMKAVVVHSANDAAVAVAEYIAGSTEAFVQMMNQRAAELGLKDTHYYSVHGLPPGPGEQPDVMSAYDCALLARELVRHPDTLRWSRIDTTPFRNGQFELRNTNHLVRTFRGCDGLKTGYYAKAGFNVVATAKRGQLRLIAVVMGSPRKPQNFHAAEVLLSRNFVDYTNYQVARKGRPAAQSVAVIGAGSIATLQPVWERDVMVFIKRGQENSALKISYDLPQSVAAPIKAGQRLGTGQVTLDGKPMGTFPLVAPNDVPAGSLFWRLLRKL